MIALLHGLGIGFAIAAPVGPVGLLCVRRTMHAGALVGLLTGLGAALADAAYGVAVAAGFTLTRWLIDHQAALRLVGALLLIALGVNSLRAFVVARGVRPGSPAVPAPVPGRLAAFVSTFALTVANPITFVGFVGVIAAAGPPTAEAAFALVVGVFLGSMLWWATLVMFVRCAHRFVHTERLRWIDLVTGVLLASIGGYLGLKVTHAWRA